MVTASARLREREPAAARSPERQQLIDAIAGLQKAERVLAECRCGITNADTVVVEGLPAVAYANLNHDPGVQTAADAWQQAVEALARDADAAVSLEACCYEAPPRSSRR